MAGLTWIFFGVCVVTCSAQFGYNPRDNPFTRQQTRSFQSRQQRPGDELLRALQISEDDHKCFTLARRPFYMTRPMQYPCNRRMNGVPVVHSFMGPFGPTCVSLFREPVHRYYKVEMCCPGYTTDRIGRCSIRVGRNTKTPAQQLHEHHQKQQQQQQQQQQRAMMKMAAQMRQVMMLRARAAMARRQAEMMQNMRNMRTMHRQMMMSQRPMMTSRRPPMSPMLGRMMSRAFNPPPQMFRRQQSQLPMPRPVQRPPISGRFIKLLRRPMVLSAVLRVPLSPSPFSGDSQRQPSTVVLSNRSPDDRINLHKFNPMEQAMPEAPQIEIPQDFQAPQEEFSQNGDNSDTLHIGDGFRFSPDSGFQGPEMLGLPDLHVDLPDKPVQMPKLIVEQAPTAEGQQTSCITTLNTAVKSCLKQNNIDVPDVMSAFGPFNDEMSSVLCQQEESIFKCITDALVDCNESEDAQVARDMLLETADTVRTMCVHREMIIGQPDVMPVDDVIGAQSNETTSVNDADTMATVENVDAIPTDVKPVEQITVIEDTVPTASASAHDAHAHHGEEQAIRHEVRAEELEIREYYLPLLIGSGVGFVILVLTGALIICCCCRRRLGKKMTMMKEPEKPPLHDEIYTINLAPPTYEVNGIPPMYYEEAKGEKITSGSPAVLQGEEAPEGDLGEGTQM